MNEQCLSPTGRHEFIDIQAGKSELARGIGDIEHYHVPEAAIETTESDAEPPELIETSDSATETDSDSDESVDDHEHNEGMFDSDAENASEKVVSVMNADDSSTEGPVQICFVEEVQKAMTEGSHAYLGGQMKIAVSHYQKALSVLLSSQVASQLTSLEVTVLRYALGVSFVSIGTIKNIADGMRCFQQILNEHTSDTDLLFIGHYGMLSAFYRHNRFTDALQPLEACLPLLDKDLSFIPCYWPGTDIIIDDFSSVERLKDHLDELLHMCKTPPIPDAVCRYPECDGHFKPQIYLTDPEFQGYVCVHCEERCTVEYHNDCWRRVKSLKKRTDKEMLNTTCVTPDCQGLIVRIRFFGHDGGLAKEVPADSEGKSKKHSSKAQKQHAKTSKGQKKEKMPKEKTAKSDLQSQRTNAGSERERSVDSVKSDKPKCASEITVSLSHVEPNADTRANSTDHSQKTFQMLPPDATNFVAIQKKTTDDNDFVAVKKKVKRTRDRPRPVTVFLDQFNQSEPAIEQPDDGRFSPPFTFAARNTAAWHVDQAEAEYWDVPFINYDNVKTLPSSRETTMHETYSNMRRRAGEAASYQQSSASDSFKPVPDRSLKDEADVRANIISMFLKLLEENGPAHPDDAIVQNELAKLPSEDQLMICQAGGIAKLLQKEIKFAVVDGYLCVTQDMTRARQMAQSRRQALLASIAAPGTSVQPIKLNGPPGAGIIPPNSALLDSLPPKPASQGLAPPKSALFSSLQMNPATSSGSGVLNSSQRSEVPLFPPVKPTLNSRSQPSAITYPSLPNLSGFEPTASPVVAIASTSQLQTINAPSKAKVDTAISAAMSSVVRKDDSTKTKLAELWSNPKPVAAASSAAPSVLINNAAQYPLSSSAGMQNAWLQSSFSHAPSSYSLPVMSQSNAFYTGSSIYSSISSTNKSLNSGDSSVFRPCVPSAEGPLACAISSDDYGGKVLPTETAEMMPSSKLKNFFPPDPAVDSNASLPNSCGDWESRFHDVFKGQASEKLLGTCSLEDIDDVSSGNELDAVYDSDENVNNDDSSAQFYPTNTDVDFDMAGLDSSGNEAQVAASELNPPSAKTTGLSVTAPPFIYPADKMGILRSGLSSATVTTVSSERTEMPKTCHSCEKISSSTQTAEDWNHDITKLHAVVEAMKQEHNIERNKLLQRIEDADNKLRWTEQQYDEEKMALAAAWKKEKLSFESHVEKLQQELNTVKANLERAYSKIFYAETELQEKTSLLVQEQEKSAALRAELDKQKKLKELLESKPGGAATFQPASFGSSSYQSFMSGSAINPPLLRPPVARPTYLSNGPMTPAGALGPFQSVMTQPTAGASAVEKPATSSAQGVKSKQSFSKIVTALSAIFPEMTDTELTKCIEEVRAARNNSLSGLTMQQIVSLVSKEVLKQKMLTQNASNVSAVNPISLTLSAGALSRPSSQHGFGSSHSGSVAGDRDVFDDEDPCIICHEELTVGETSQLDCGHEYHTECIRKWFKEQNTCPTCRNHALLPDDFPSLATVYRYPGLQNDRGNFR